MMADLKNNRLTDRNPYIDIDNLYLRLVVGLLLGGIPIYLTLFALGMRGSPLGFASATLGCFVGVGSYHYSITERRKKPKISFD